MKTAFLSVMLLSLTIGPVAVVAQEKGALPLPDPGNVTLTLDEYNKLMELASKPVKKLDTPPLPYSLKHATLKLKAGDDSVLGTIQFDGEVLKKGTIKVPLTPGWTILDARREGKGVPLLQENGIQTAVLSGPADFSILLDAGLPLRIEAGRASMSLPVPSAGSTTLSLVVPGEHTSVNISPGLITSRTSENGQTTVEATLAPGQPAVVWWATRETATPVVAREVRFLADLKTLVSVSEADLAVGVLADVTVVQGDPSQFEVEVPAGYEITVTGASLDSTKTQAGILTLKVNNASQRSHEFLISMERPLSASKTDAPFLTFKNAQRETGEVLVEGAGSMEITATESGNLKRMDVKEANPYLRSLAHFPPQAAFRYHRQPTEAPTLALEWVRFPDSSVLGAVAENAVVTTLVTSEGKSLTEVKLVIKNQAQPFLKVALPAGASVLSADVAGEKVKPVEGPDGNRVPLLRAGFRPTDAYTVSFVFLHSGAPFAKKGGSDISLPGMDIPIDLLQWEVFLPEQYKVKDFGGDVLAADLVPPAFVESNVGATNELMQEAAPVAGNFNFRMESLLPGQLGGGVLDPSGAVVGNAQVTVTSSETGYKMNAATNAEGFWRVFGAPSGRLKIRIDSPGFKSMVQDVIYDANRPGPFNTVLQVGSVSETVEVSAVAVGSNYDYEKEQREAKKQAQAAQNAPSSNVLNLQRRVAGVLPVAIEVPHAGTAFHFVRPLVVNEETKVTFTYKSK
jgi:Carboxypeptidase regulatory-like domain